MLSERITAIFTLLHCNNTEIARYAGCSSGNISISPDSIFDAT